MKKLGSRLQREAKTVALMIRVYCRGNHRPVAGELCAECNQLLDYSLQRLDSCPFQDGKTICSLCPVHCYKPVMRQQIRAVMRYAGPRMMSRYPILAIHHLLDRRRKQPLRRKELIK